MKRVAVFFPVVLASCVGGAPGPSTGGAPGSTDDGSGPCIDDCDGGAAASSSDGRAADAPAPPPTSSGSDGSAPPPPNGSDAAATDGSTPLPPDDAAPPGIAIDPRYAAWPVPPVTQQTFTPALNGNFTDDVSGLVWEGTMATSPLSQPEATAHCAGLPKVGPDGFRIPTRIELLSIIDFGKTSPAFDRQRFQALPTATEDRIWTSSMSPMSPGEITFVWSSDGRTQSFAPQQVRALLICVASMTPVTAWPDGGHRRFEFVPGGSGIHDKGTGLVWKQDAFTQGTPVPTTDGCVGHYGAGWRWPTIKELATLVDEANAPPVDSYFGGGTGSLTLYFGSTAYSGGSVPQVWNVDMGNGLLGHNPRAYSPMYLRCVQSP